MNFRIISRKLGKVITFSRPGGGYVYVDLNDQPGTLGCQICAGGSLSGSTITAGGDAAEFERVCRRWWRQYLQQVG